ncbi:T-cell surface antigen CD2-like isoform X2 [Xyrauchen texanus]|uniref:T-cell surface antigen CD2-like isoform X2 n=1 Tax=Xyrauchen texanus TaxID=154827 RepID=UPI0022429C40|nr:T-cell surface antigen CD2-like isoform X2 [Xyrauchen texanus]
MFQLLKMNTFQESCCSIFGILLFFLLQGSCVIVHKAVGSSLRLMHDIPKENLSLVQWKLNETMFAEYDGTKFNDVKQNIFAGRLRMNLSMSHISVTVEELHFQDSGRFSIVAEGPQSKQYKTQDIELHVQDPIRDVQIKSNFTWQESKNTCTFHLHCLVSGDLKPSYNWSGYEVGSEQHLHFNLHPSMSVTLNCTASNRVSIKSSTLTVKCSEESISSFLQYKYLLIAVGTGIMGILMLSGIIAACCRWRTNKEKGESEAEITVYEDVNSGGTARTTPQTLYDKINYQRHPADGPSTSSPNQEVFE